MSELFLQRLHKRGESTPVTVSISLISHGMNVAIKFKASDGLSFIIKGRDLDFIETFEPVVQKIKNGLPTKGENL